MTTFRDGDVVWSNGHQREYVVLAVDGPTPTTVPIVHVGAGISSLTLRAGGLRLCRRPVRPGDVLRLKINGTMHTVTADDLDPKWPPLDHNGWTHADGTAIEPTRPQTGPGVAVYEERSGVALRRLSAGDGVACGLHGTSYLVGSGCPDCKARAVTRATEAAKRMGVAAREDWQRHADAGTSPYRSERLAEPAAKGCPEHGASTRLSCKGCFDAAFPGMNGFHDVPATPTTDPFQQTATAGDIETWLRERSKKAESTVANAIVSRQPIGYALADSKPVPGGLHEVEVAFGSTFTDAQIAAGAVPGLGLARAAHNEDHVHHDATKQCRHVWRNDPMRGLVGGLTCTECDTFVDDSAVPDRGRPRPAMTMTLPTVRELTRRLFESDPDVIAYLRERGDSAMRGSIARWNTTLGRAESVPTLAWSMRLDDPRPAKHMQIAWTRGSEGKAPEAEWFKRAQERAERMREGMGR